MTTHASYRIGTPGHPWGEAEVAAWLSRQTVKRRYETDVLRVLDALSPRYDVHAGIYEGLVNLMVAPCVSPWAYEVIQRWNMHAIDPNRSFRDDSPAQESASLAAVSKVTHIASADRQGEIIGSPMVARGGHQLPADGARPLRKDHSRTLQDDDRGLSGQPSGTA